MKKISLLFVVALAMLAFAGVAFAHDATITLTEQNGSGQNGTAAFVEQPDGSTMVTIELSNGSSTPQPAHIHKGTCANLDPAPLYPLNNVVNGKSVTIIQVDVHDLTGGTYAVNVHKSAAEASVYVSCGNIVAASHEEESTPGMPTTGAGDSLPLLGATLFAAFAAMSLGMTLRRRARG